MTHQTDAPVFVLFEERKQADQVKKKRQEEMQTQKEWDYSDVVWSLKLEGDLNVQEKMFVKQMAKAGFKRKIFK